MATATVRFSGLSLSLVWPRSGGLLIAQGLYPDQARALLETWRFSWFEEGSRRLYIAPRHSVNTELPLSINPAPSQIVRVFVDRLELITPTPEQAVEKALATRDRSTIEKYGRFRGPILDELKAENPRPSAGVGQRVDGHLLR